MERLPTIPRQYARWISVILYTLVCSLVLTGLYGFIYKDFTLIKELWTNTETFIYTIVAFIAGRKYQTNQNK